MYAWVIGFRLWIQSSREGRKDRQVSAPRCMVHALDHQCEIKGGRGSLSMILRKTSAPAIQQLAADNKGWVTDTCRTCWHGSRYFIVVVL
jgi:hypothetical protein